MLFIVVFKFFPLFLHEIINDNLLTAVTDFKNILRIQSITLRYMSKIGNLKKNWKYC